MIQIQNGNPSRIKILDGFRAIAIISVVLYHYFYRWNDSKLPYFGGDFFHQGFRGVGFFFIISGFIICYTLENTSNFVLFWKKRFIRLFPSMLIASVLTFFFLILFDDNLIFPKSHNFRNLITSITFLPPNVFDLIFRTRNHFSYLNLSYWTLWPEIQFYFLASVLYFSNKIQFKRNFIIVSFGFLLLYNFVLFFNLNEIKVIEKLINLFNLVKYLSNFVCGALFYMIYKKYFFSYKYFTLLMILFFLINLPLNTDALISNLMMFVLFFCFIYCPHFLKILEQKIVIKIGVSSYFLYLIHEYIGVVWIRNYASVFYPYSFIAPIVMIIIMITFSVFYTVKIEPKITLPLKNYLLKK
jgi:peptidoglycan/LPS O-acetylase OafA/YrhL